MSVHQSPTPTAPDSRRFVLAHTAIASAPLVPELRLHLATEVTPLWQATETEMTRVNLPPPYWAFVWPGGQAVARYCLDHPGLVRGRRVLDFAAGSGIAGLAAVRAGAARVTAADIDRFAQAAMALNADLNGLALSWSEDDLLGGPVPEIDVILAGDVCYEQPMAGRVLTWLRGLAAAGVEVVMGDPGRNFAPRDGVTLLARYAVPTSLELEDKTCKDTAVWRLEPG